MSLPALRRLSDEQLGRRLAQGEAAAFDELYDRYLHRLAAYGAHLLGDASAGDDVAQSTLVKAYGALRAGRAPEHLKPWLYRIAHNTAVDLAVRRHELPMASLPERASFAPAATAGVLVSALAALPDRQRHVYLLREVHGLRVSETATALRLEPAQVEQALFAARNRLAEQLVFGDRLSCVAVRRLVQGPLDGTERRALKTHLRSCPSCRKAVGAKAGAFGLVPAAADWLKALPGLLAGGGAPVAAKVGVAVATVTLVGGGSAGFEFATEKNPRPPHPSASRRPAPAAHISVTRTPDGVPRIPPTVESAVSVKLTSTPGPTIDDRRDSSSSRSGEVSRDFSNGQGQGQSLDTTTSDRTESQRDDGRTNAPPVTTTSASPPPPTETDGSPQAALPNADGSGQSGSPSDDGTSGTSDG